MKRLHGLLNDKNAYKCITRIHKVFYNLFVININVLNPIMYDCSLAGYIRFFYTYLLIKSNKKYIT